ncbi:PREDICTED: reverse mRNAase [Prunus dulcis]|uniref:PREDICTED: reverse mRNAase n=1 Tax=Prunus dulcis TaxID=3755 RepID=A0A5E4FEB7_PRUDU|nr:PREDICTED: reverse mRNAase [Prunus dulcis]
MMGTSGTRQWLINLKECMNALVKWSRNQHPNNKVKIAEVLKELNLRPANQDIGTFLNEKNRLMSELEQLWKNEELYWKQKSRRRQRNRIWKIKNEAGVWIAGDKMIQNEFQNYFVNLFKSSGPRNWNGIMDHIPQLVNNDMNGELMRPFSLEEVKDAIFQIGSLKAPGPDGFPAMFYQKYWLSVQDIISRSAEEFYTGQSHIRDINKTFIALIPKLVQDGVINGIRVSRRAPILSQLFFADDSLFFVKAEEENCSRLKGLLDDYCLASGQLIDYEKSSLMFSANTPEDVKANTSSIMGVRGIDNYGIYLVIPMTWGQSKKVALAYIRERVAKKIMGWKQGTLSMARNEVLIKAIATSCPSLSYDVF